MGFLLFGLWITGAIFVIVPWESIPICLPHIHLEAVRAASSGCTLTGDITRWLGAGTIMCTLPLVSGSTRKYAGTLIIAGMLALVIMFLYWLNPGNCRQTILPCRSKDIYIVSTVGLVQLLLAVAGFRKIMQREKQVILPGESEALPGKRDV